MALTRGALVAAFSVALMAGCSATAPPRAVTSEAAPAGAAPSAERKDIERSCPDARNWTSDGTHSVWWETFRRTKESLLADIARRAEALQSGPIGSRGKKLASLRLAATAHDLFEAGSKSGALEALQRAVSLDAGNGYAWLWLAYATPGPQAGELADKAGRTLPEDPGVRCELAGLRSKLRNAAGKGFGGNDENSRN